MDAENNKMLTENLINNNVSNKGDIEMKKVKKNKTRKYNKADVEAAAPKTEVQWENNVAEPVKRKRGRPRKSETLTRMVHQDRDEMIKSAVQDIDSAQKKVEALPPKAEHQEMVAQQTSKSEDSAQEAMKRRGRPKGSKNKPKEMSRGRKTLIPEKSFVTAFKYARSLNDVIEEFDILQAMPIEKAKLYVTQRAANIRKSGKFLPLLKPGPKRLKERTRQEDEKPEGTKKQQSKQIAREAVN